MASNDDDSTTCTSSLRKQIFNEYNSEPAKLNDLNNRFVSFLDAVKLQTIKRDQLQEELLEKRNDYFNQIRDKNEKLYEELVESKRKLNEVALGLNGEIVRERRNKMLADWYSKMALFETAGSISTRVKLSHPTRSLVKQRSKILSSSLNELNIPNEANAPTQINCNNSFNISNISVGSTLSISSTSSSSGFAYSNSSNNITTSSPQSTTQLEVSASFTANNNDSFYIQSRSNTIFSLEIYLNKVKQTRNCLQIEYDKKYQELNDLTVNCNNLNKQLNCLNDNLDEVKLDNIDLNHKILNLKKQIDFYRKLNELNKPLNTDLVCQKSNDSNSDCSESFLHKIKQETVIEYQNYSKVQLQNYDTYLENEFMQELEFYEQEYFEKADEFDSESNQILDELIELNGQLADSIGEYEMLNKINYQLNSRLIELSDKLCSYSQMNKDQKERVFLNYSISDLKARIEKRKNQVDQLRIEANQVRTEFEKIHEGCTNSLGHCKKDEHKSLNFLNATFTLSPSMSTSSLRSSASTGSLCSLNNSSISKQENSIAKSLIKLPTKLNESKRFIKIKNSQNKTANYKSLLDDYKLIPYYAQIEYTKSNLFAYFVIKFDILSNYITTRSIRRRINMNNLRFQPISQHKVKGTFTIKLDDSLDGSSILIENTHRILDFDLSDWTLRREILNTVNSDFFNKNFNLEYDDFFSKNDNFSKMMEEEEDSGFDSINGEKRKKKILIKNYAECSSLDCLDNLVNGEHLNSDGSKTEIIEYKFPKGLRLKRRKKIKLIASGSKNEENNLNGQTSEQKSCNKSGKDVAKGTRSSSLASLNTFKMRPKKSISELSTISTDSSSNTSTKSQIIRSKCSCCACKMFVTRKGDMELFEVKEIPSFGSGLLVITKLINKKNIAKLVSYKYIKHIWVNNHDLKKDVLI